MQSEGINSKAPQLTPFSEAISSWQVFAILLIAAAAVLAPAFAWGFPKGNDLEFHLPIWIDVRQQWSEHIFDLRWAGLAQYGYGQPVLSFYPPISYALGAGLSLVFGWAAVPFAYVAVVLLAAGAAMFKFAGRFLPGNQAVIAAVLFECNPYAVFRIYHSSALAEILAGALFPLLFMFALGLKRGKRGDVFLLAATFAAIWLINIPAGIIASYSLAVLIGVQSLIEKSATVLIRGAGASLLGFAVSAFHLIPGIFEQRWINVGGLDDPALLPENNFLLAWGYDPDVKWFAVILSCMVLFGLLTGLVSVLINWRKRQIARPIMLAIAACLLFNLTLLFSFSSPAWLYLPKIRLIQFPWRWLLVFQTGCAFLAAAALPRIRKHAWSMAAAYVCVSLSVLAVTADYWHPGAGAEIFARIAREGGYFGRPEYMPPGIDQNKMWSVYASPLVSVFRKEDGFAPSVKVARWSASHKEFEVRSSGPRIIALRLQYYPAWRAELNGNPVSAFMDRSNGRMLLRVPGGLSRIRVDWQTTPARKLGWGVTAFALIFVIVGVFTKIKG